MKTKLLFLIALVFVAFNCENEVPQQVFIPEDELIFEKQDSIIFEKVIAEFKKDQNLPIGELITKVGRYFLDAPYVGHTIEVGENEELVINLRELDCTTFAENCLTLSRTLKSGDSSFEKYALELEKLRYRNGVREAYPSRLHYFSDWIFNNREKELITTPADEFGEPFPVEVNFMSTHPDSYKHLKAHPEFIPIIEAQEKEISSREYFYLPKEKIAANEHQLREGDLIGLTTKIPGLDISHVGILVKKDGRIHLMHASLSNKRVLISEEPLAEWLLPSEKNTGIIVVRPNEVSSNAQEANP